MNITCNYDESFYSKITIRDVATKPKNLKRLTKRRQFNFYRKKLISDILKKTRSGWDWNPKPLYVIFEKENFDKKLVKKLKDDKRKISHRNFAKIAKDG